MQNLRTAVVRCFSLNNNVLECQLLKANLTTIINRAYKKVKKSDYQYSINLKLVGFY